MPSALRFMERLPMTLSGKVDRVRLAALSRGDLRLGDPASESSDRAMRDAIGAIYAECLGARPVRSDADFFGLGGDSLKAMRVASRLRNELGCEVSVRDIFEHSRVDQLAHVLERRTRVTADAESDALASEAPVLSFSQERLWMAEQLAVTTAAYNIPAAILITGTLD